MNKFKFLTGEPKIQQRNIEIFTRDTMSRFIIPIDLHGHILNHGLYALRRSRYEDRPSFYRDEDSSAYHYKVTHITPPYGDMITIDYEIMFPDSIVFRKFTTTSRIR